MDLHIRSFPFGSEKTCFLCLKVFPFFDLCRFYFLFQGVKPLREEDKFIEEIEKVLLVNNTKSKEI